MKVILTGMASLLAMGIILRPVVTEYSILNPLGLATWMCGVAIMLFVVLQALKTPITPE
ncbi:MAG: hypothetical protein JSS27_15385 [Planctomycetes bacterium]|nr:hypothetical protein [Planctomycetota bacterium]